MEYSYAELKGKIKVGDMVRAISGKNNPCSELRNDGSNTQKITEVNDGYFSINGCLHRYHQGVYLEILPKTMENVAFGDIIVSKGGDKRKVLGRCDDVVFLSSSSDYGEADTCIYHWQELEDNWSVEEEEEVITQVVEVTADEALEELAKSRGVDVSTLRIKK